MNDELWMWIKQYPNRLSLPLSNFSALSQTQVGLKGKKIIRDMKLEN